MKMSSAAFSDLYLNLTIQIAGPWKSVLYKFSQLLDLRNTRGWIMRIKIFISVLWSLHNMRTPEKLMVREKKRKKKREKELLYQYRPLLVKQLPHLLYWLLCKKITVKYTHTVLLLCIYVYACLVHISFCNANFFSTFICCRPKSKQCNTGP